MRSSLLNVQLSMRRVVRVVGLLVVTLLLCTPSSVAIASSSCDGDHDVSEVSNALKYSGPQQRIHREGKLNFRCFNAQHWEDLYMFQTHFANVSQGFFIELGALDGWSYSVSYFFEQFLNWRGLLIEASPRNHQQFKAKMKKLPAKRRRRSDYILSAVCNEPKPLTYVSKEGTGAGILEFMPEDQQIRNRKMCKVDDEAHVLGGGQDGAVAPPLNPNECTLTKIQCIHLGDMLRARGVKKVDMFVLDVEGAELEVLSTLRLNEIPVHFFLIELDGKAPEKDAKVRCILRQHHYEPLGRLDLNEIWRRKDFNADGSFDESYGAPVPASHWSSCFRTPVDEASFFIAGDQQVRVKHHHHGANNNNNNRVVASDVETLDKDYDTFSVEGTPKPSIDGRGRRHEAVYGGGHHRAGDGDVSDFNDVLTVATWLMVLGVPLSIVCMVVLRRRRRPIGAGGSAVRR